MTGRVAAADAYRQAVDDYAELLAQLEALKQVLADEQRLDEAIDLLSRLIARLEVHFRHEEEGDYFRKVAERAPQLERLATTLEHEHPQLLRRLREIGAHLESCRQAKQGLPKVAAEFHDFVTAISSHEEDEQRLISLVKPPPLAVRIDKALPFRAWV